MNAEKTESGMRGNRWQRKPAGPVSLALSIMLLLLASCGGRGGSGTPAETSAERSAAQNSEAASETSAESAEGGTEQRENAESAENSGDAESDRTWADPDWGYEEGEPLEVETGQYTRIWYNPAVTGNDDTAAATAEIAQVHLTDDGMMQWKRLDDALEDWNGEQKKKAFDEMQSMADGMTADGVYPYYVESDIGIRRADTEALSFLAEISSFYGGAHPNTGFVSVNLDPETGREISLTDVISDPEKLPEALKKALLKAYTELEDAAFEDIAETLKTYKAADYVWTLEKDGVRFWFAPYALAPYAAGAQNAELYFEDDPGLFTGRGQNAPEDSIYKCGAYETISSRTSDGTVRDYRLTGEPDESGMYSRIALQYWKQGENPEHPGSVSLEESCYGWTPYLVERGADRFLWIFAREENDWTTLYVYDLSGGEPVLSGKLDGVAPAVRNTETENMFRDPEESGARTEDTPDTYRTAEPANPDAVRLERRMQVLSTYGGIRTFYVDDTGVPVPDGGIYEASNHIRLRTKADVRMRRSDWNAFSEGEEVTVSAGTNLSIQYTDGDKKVWLSADDGTLYLALLTENPEGWPDLIDGRPIDEVFDGLLFAG